MTNDSIECEAEIRNGTKMIWLTGEDLLNMFNPDACWAV